MKKQLIPTKAKIKIYGGKSENNLILTTTDREVTSPCIAEVLGDGGRLPQKANAALIVAAWNAAQEINSDNPISAAEALPDIVKAVELAIIYIEDGAPQTAADRLRAALGRVLDGKVE
jgi:hypothetical protein